jgi:hypothetical protein
MCFVWLSQANVTEAESVYSAVRTEYLYKTDTFFLKGFIKRLQHVVETKTNDCLVSNQDAGCAA